MNTMCTRRLAVLVAGLLGGGAALGQPAAGLTAKLKADAEEKGRAEVADLLRTLCPEQCVLPSVEARVEEEMSSEAPPGFEQVTPGARIPIVRSLNASLTADSELPAAFRTKLKSLVTQRLKGLAAQAN